MRQFRPAATPRPGSVRAALGASDPEQAQARAGADRQAVAQRHGVARRQRQRVEARALARGVAVVQMGADAAVRRLHQAALQRQLQTPGIGAAAGSGSMRLPVSASVASGFQAGSFSAGSHCQPSAAWAAGAAVVITRAASRGPAAARQRACSCDLHGPNLDRLTRREHEIDHVPVLCCHLFRTAQGARIDKSPRLRPGDRDARCAPGSTPLDPGRRMGGLQSAARRSSAMDMLETTAQLGRAAPGWSGRCGDGCRRCCCGARCCRR